MWSMPITSMRCGEVMESRLPAPRLSNALCNRVAHLDRADFADVRIVRVEDVTGAIAGMDGLGDGVLV